MIEVDRVYSQNWRRQECLKNFQRGNLQVRDFKQGIRIQQRTLLEYDRNTYQYEKLDRLISGQGLLKIPCECGIESPNSTSNVSQECSQFIIQFSLFMQCDISPICLFIYISWLLQLCGLKHGFLNSQYGDWNLNPREKFESGPGFEPRTSRSPAQRSNT